MTTPERARRDITDVCAILIDEFADDLPEQTVLRCVEGAASAVTLFGEDPEAFAAVVERIARSDLEQIAAGRDTRARLDGVRQPRRQASAGG